MLALIRGTSNSTDLQVDAFLLDRTYQTGIKVSDDVMHLLSLERHNTCPNWNYTLRPRAPCPAPT